MCGKQTGHSSDEKQSIVFIGRRSAFCTFGDKRDFSASNGIVSGAVQHECCFLGMRAKECDSDADNCEFSLLHSLRMGGFFSEVLKESLPTF